MNTQHSSNIWEKELQLRAEREKPKTRLVANYYRIRRKLAYPLPLRSLSTPTLKIPDIPNYPWGIWLLWDLEERMNALRWAAYSQQDDSARSLYLDDLEALAEWPRYRERPIPDLSAAHAARLLFQAYQEIPDLGSIRDKIEAAFQRLLDDILPEARKLFGLFHKAEEVLSRPEPHEVLHNFPWIGATSVGLAARALNHPDREEIDRFLSALLAAFLECRKTGLTEGVAYDGYILDFVLPWLEGLPEKVQDEFLSHPRLGDMPNQSLLLGVPGNAANVAEIGDVEPDYMPFHLSALAKLLLLREDPQGLWHLRRCPASWLRSDALAALLKLQDRSDREAEISQTADANYALALRSGWNQEDLAVVMSANQSPMGHLPPDSATIVIGSRGRWLIDDPGYQQYMQNAERNFSRGPQAHNAPLINGCETIRRPTRRQIAYRQDSLTLQRMEIEFSETYPEDLSLERVRRIVWLLGNTGVVVADEIRGKSVKWVDYNWHGHPDLAWWEENGKVCLYAPDGTTLWIQNPQNSLSMSDITRVSGSRGQLTLQSQITHGLPWVWWVFSLGSEPPPFEFHSSNSVLSIGEATLNPDL